MNRLPLLALFLVFPCVTGCGGHSASEPVGSDRVSLLTIAPAAGTRLAAGSVVAFSATVSYELESESQGAILLVVQDQDGHLLTIGPQDRASVSHGQGTATVLGHVTVPATGVSQVRVFLPLVPPDVSAAQFLPASPVQPDAIYPVGP
jgi:hypothetical protein